MPRAIMLCVSTPFRMLAAKGRTISVPKRSHQGRAIVHGPDDGWWRLRQNISGLRGVVCSVCSCLDRVISHCVAGISMRWQRLGSSGPHSVHRGRAMAKELALLPDGSANAEILSDYAVMREQARLCSRP